MRMPLAPRINIDRKPHDRGALEGEDRIHADRSLTDRDAGRQQTDFADAESAVDAAAGQ